MMKFLPSKNLVLTLFSVLLFYAANAQVVINEVFVSPSTTSSSTTNSNSLYNTDPNEQPPLNREWIELYNTSPCDTIDLSCYTLGSNMEPPPGSSYANNWGAFTFPSGTKILPLGFLIVGGNNAQVPVLDFNMNYYRQNFFGSQYLDGDATRWFLRDEYGWIGLYDPSGVAVNAVYWDLYGNASNLGVQEEYAHPIQTYTTCSGYQSLAAAKNISGIEYAGQTITSVDFSLQRTSDGASTWYPAATTPTPRFCNSDCVGPPEVNCFVVHESCVGGDGSITVTISNGSTPPYTIQWLHPIISNQASITGLTEGSYIVSVTDASGCITVYDTAIVLRLSGPSIYSANVANETCTLANGFIDLTVTGSNVPFSYHWNNNASSSPDISSLAAGTYSVTVTDNLGCTDTMSFLLIDQPGPDLEITSVVNEMCSASNGIIETQTLSGTAPLHYIWNGNASLNTSNLNNIQAGYYSVIVTDANGCSSSADTTLTDTPPPIVSFTNVMDEMCHKGNGSATLHLEGGSPPYSFSWLEFPPVSDTNLSNLSEGIYHVEVSDSNCAVNSQVQINNIPGPVAAFRVYPEATSIEMPRIVFYDESMGATQWYWDFGDWRYSDIPSPIHEYRDTGVFKVTLMIHDDQGCMDSVSHEVLIISPITLFIPNAFTPNADGLNDQWLTYGMHISDFEIYIFNRWGGEVFHSVDMSNGWNGTQDGQASPEGVYSWVIWYRDDFEIFQTDRRVLTGSLTLIR